jgi:glycosyltransferase involved in cell wall biosynthesis
MALVVTRLPISIAPDVPPADQASLKGSGKADAADPVLLTGTDVRTDAVICVVVLSVHSDPRTREAVVSLLQQDVPAEIVVVNTGTGSLRGHLAQELSRLVLVESSERHFAGGARNLGIRHSTAPVVAFLACDCLATPGWLQARLDAHRAGEKAVSSALAPVPDRNGRIGRVAWAAFAMTHIGRAAETSPETASRYGLSYCRSLFVRHGRFDEKLPIGEDTAFNRHVASEHPIPWHPEVVTLHRYPSNLPAAMADQLRRGRRAAAYHRDLDGRPPWRHLPHVLLHGLLVDRRIRQGLSPRQTRRLSVRLLVTLLTIANILGALSLYATTRRSAPAGRGIGH